FTGFPAETFTGFPAETFEFYEQLSANNTRAWWAEHKLEYERVVRTPLMALLAALDTEFGSAHVFRPHRDARFSKDKTPLKDHQGAVVQVEDAIAYYVQISASGLMVGAGWYSPQGQQLRRFRESVDGPVGSQLEVLLAGLPTRFERDGRPLATRPRGYDPDNPRIELLRYRMLVASSTYPAAPWLGTHTAFNTVRDDWRALRPLVEWLADHVGPADDPGSAD
ncbi:MAG: DUF2461 domain-containing protein, partial [Actinobacteria bacterium]|nr:DUF2461 domain-containing protein [Actinomycetota bacterium]